MKVFAGKYLVDEMPMAFPGRDRDEGESLRLADAQGNNRVILKVREDGTLEIEFLDALGKVTERWPKEAVPRVQARRAL
jgi:hypothetical protein